MASKASENLGKMHDDNTLYEFFAAIVNDMREQNTDVLTITASLPDQIVTFDMTLVGVQRVAAVVDDEQD